MFITQAILLLAFTSASFASPVPYAETLVRRMNSPSTAGTAKYANWPEYSQLPLKPEYPFRAAWDVWGSQDEVGALNHITNDTILAAAQEEIQIGRAINMNLLLGEPYPPFNADRRALTHSILPFSGYLDDQVVLNTQSSTQYDGKRHFPYQNEDADESSYQWYNDLVTFQDVVGAEGVNGPTLGLQNDANYGIAGKAVLFDWAGWMDSKGSKYDPFSNRTISVSELQQVAKWQGLDVEKAFARPGAFLLVRTGVTQAYRELSSQEQVQIPYRSDDYAFVGMEASEATLKFLWDHKVSLVGSDNPAFEKIPFGNAAPTGPARSLHQTLISGWGLSIVELLDLEVVAEVCAKEKRYTFFFTLQNLNVMGGVASPPNAMALL